MKYTDLKPEFKISNQILPQDFPELKSKGIKTIIVNRPDGESSDQPSFERIKQEAEKYGMAAHYHPVEVGANPIPQVEEILSKYNSLPKPILAYCKSGTRSTFIHKGLLERL